MPFLDSSILLFLFWSNMPRCKRCLICLDVIAFRKTNKGNCKKIKEYETKKKCKYPIASSNKQKLTEAQILSAGGTGGQIRG